MIDCYNEVAPNFKSSILHRDIVGPYEMEQEYGLIGGNIFHGELSLEQLFHMRPGARLRGLPHAGPRPVLRQLGDPRRRRRLRHPRLAGGPRGDRGPQGQPPRRPGHGPQDHPALMTERLAPSLAGPQDDGIRHLPAGPGDHGHGRPGDARGAPDGAGRRLGAARQLRRADGRRGGQEPVPAGSTWSTRATGRSAGRLRAVPGRPAGPRRPGPARRAGRGAGGAADAGRPAGRPVRGDLRQRLGGAGRGAAAGAAGGPVPLRGRLAATARGAGMALCGAGCMGFVNVAYGLRAIGYVEPDPLPAGPVALVTHSGSVFSALLRTRRAIGYTLAVSSGQELVTPAAAYLEYALDAARTRGASRWSSRPCASRPGCARCWPPPQRGTSRWCCSPWAARRPGGPWWRRTPARWPRVTAAGRRWPARYGVHRVGDLAELADTLELFGAGRRARWPSGGAAHGRRAGIATVHDSGLERAHTADLADGPASRSRRSARPPRSGWPGCSTRACSRPTRWTCGAPAATPRACSPGR